MDNTKPSNQDFPLSFNAYAAFDAQSLKTLMQQRLSENGVFTDQIFEGSNFNNLLDVIAYSYNVLLYYLNQTSNESLFTNATLYENMNKIVKLINYKPIGVQTSILNFNATANDQLSPGVYTIPRFSYFTINDIFYSFNSDLTFVKGTSGIESLDELGNFTVLYQGQFVEYPIYISTGENYEEISIVSVDSDGNNDPIDHNNIFVFVRDRSGKWREWSRVESIFLQNGGSECFEVRLNENQRYSIKLGNNVTGKKLTAGDLVAVYYLRSDKETGQVGPGTLDGNQIFFYSTDQFNTIFNDVINPNNNIITFEEANNVTFTNTDASTEYSDVESVAQIRKNAPNTFRQQGRAVTTDDFRSYIISNFGNIITDAYVVNNWEYLDQHINYLYNIGLKEPSLDSRVLSNQIKFADSCNFNNVYVYVIPKKLITNDFTFDRGFLGDGLKDYIINKLEKIKTATVEIIIQDPVYLALGIAAPSQDEILNKQLRPTIINESKLVVSRSLNSNTSFSDIRNKVKEIILQYFSFNNIRLGQLIDVQGITQSILGIDGVDAISTQRGDITLPGINLLGFNPAYSEPNEDISVISQNIKLPYFKAPYWFDVNLLNSQIEVIASNMVSSAIREY